MPTYDPNTFDVLNWFRQYVKADNDLQGRDLDDARNLVLMWGAFEREACGKFAKPEGIRKSVEQADRDGKLSLADFASHAAFLKGIHDSYENTDKFMGAIKATKHKDGLHSDIEAFVTGRKTDVNNVVVALLLIAYRVRNNTFHGEKSPNALRNQQPLFRCINSLLATYLAALGFVVPN
jgi:hypothetical protein